MPEQKTFEGPLAPVAWEMIARGWDAHRDERGDLLVHLSGDDLCLCRVIGHEPAPSNPSLGLGRSEYGYVVVASVPVVDAVKLSHDLLDEMNTWADARKVPVGTLQVNPVDRPGAGKDVVAIAIEYRIAGGGFRPEEVSAVVADIAPEVGSLRKLLEENFGAVREEPDFLSDFDVRLTIEGEDGELLNAPEREADQLDLFERPVSPWRKNWHGASNDDALPEACREILEWAKSEGYYHGLPEANVMLLAKSCARRDPVFFDRVFGKGAAERMMNASRHDLDKGGAWNVRHLLRRVAEKRDPTRLLLPSVMVELSLLKQDFFEPILEADPEPSREPAREEGDASRSRRPRDPREAKAPRGPDDEPFALTRAEIEETLKQRVKGQDEAAEQVASRIAMTFRGLNGNTPRPKGVFLFAGPTGVGKTEMAKAIADTVYGAGNNIIRLDMSEYRERYANTRLIGPPPGYLGHDEPASWLTTRIIKNPRQVLLLDEFEKASPEVWQTFLQVFEEGCLTDGRGEVADFSKAVIILTSNLGSRAAAVRPTGFGQAMASQEVATHASREVMKAVRQALPPELFNRLDGTFTFDPLDHELLVEIARTKLRMVKGELAEVGYELTFTPAVAPAVATFEADPALGARPMLRAIDRLIREPLADLEPGKYKVRAPGGEVQVAA